MRCFSNDGQAGIIIFVITNEVLCVYKSIIMIFHFNDEKYESGFYYVNAMIIEKLYVVDLSESDNLYHNCKSNFSSG